MKYAVLLALALACAGADGEDGEDGARGPQGEAAPPVGVVDGVLCQSSTADSITFLSAYLWFFSDGTSVGVCFIDEFAGSESSPIIGNQCFLQSRQSLIDGAASGLVTITFGDNGATLSGAFTGTMTCT